jgi:hypothetical protein
LLRHVGLNAHGSSTGVGDFLQDFFSGILILMVVDNYGSATPRQANDGSRANAAARAGDERDLSRETVTFNLTCHC